MRKTLLVFCAVATLFACNKNEQPVGYLNNEDIVNVGEDECLLTIEFPDLAPETKVTYGTADGTLSNVQVMVYDDANSNRLESSVKITSGNTATLKVSRGAKHVYAVANSSTNFLQTATASSIASSLTDLSDNNLSTGAFIMYGSNTVTASAATASVSVSLVRPAAKFEVGSVKVQLNPALAGKSVKIKEIFLYNAASKSNLGANLAAGSIVLKNTTNTGHVTDATYDPYMYESFADVTIADGSTESTKCQKQFYAYPNPNTSSNVTWLVVKADVGDVTNLYYTVAFSGAIQANKIYKLETLTIKNYGTSTIMIPEQSTLTVTLSVSPWTTGETISKEI